MAEQHALRRPWLIGFAVATAVMLVRLYPRFAQPGLWAEDGFQFLAGSLQDGTASLLKPYAGYFHTVPRLVALLVAKLLPLRFFASAVCVASGLLYAFVASLFAREQYRAYVPSDLHRVALCGVLCLAPAQFEVLGNLTNLHWVLTFGVWIVALRPAAEPLRRWELAFIVLGAASAGEVVVLAPMFAYRAWMRRPKPSEDGVAVALLASFGLINVLVREPQTGASPPGLASGLAAMWGAWCNFIAYGGWLGPEATAWLGGVANRNFFSLWALLALAAVCVVFWRRREAADLQLALALLTLLLLPLLMAMVREGVAAYFAQRGPSLIDFEFRYAFVFSMASAVFWLSVLRPGKRVVGFLFVALIAATSLHAVPIVPAYENSDWHLRAKELAAGPGTVVVIRVAPNGDVLPLAVP